MRLKLLGILILLLFAVPSIAQDEAVIIGEAMVSSIEIDDSEGIVITIRGDMPDSCTEIGEITQSLEENIIFLSVATTRPANAICAAVLTSFETSYELDTSDIETGDYALDVNGITETITIIASADAETIALTCPEANEETVLFDDLGMCFLYPVDFEEISGNDFVLISQPLTSNAVFLITVADADAATLDDLREQFEDVELTINDTVIAGVDALIIESDDTREAYVIVNEQIFAFFVQPLDDENDIAELLWSSILDSIFFPEPESE